MSDKTLAEGLGNEDLQLGKQDAPARGRVICSLGGERRRPSAGLYLACPRREVAPPRPPPRGQETPCRGVDAIAALTARVTVGALLQHSVEQRPCRPLQVSVLHHVSPWRDEGDTWGGFFFFCFSFSFQCRPSKSGKGHASSFLCNSTDSSSPDSHVGWERSGVDSWRVLLSPDVPSILGISSRRFITQFLRLLRGGRSLIYVIVIRKTALKGKKSI